MKRSIWLSFFLGVLAIMLITGCDTRRDDNRVDDRTTVTDENNTDKDKTNTDIGTEKNTERDISLFETHKDYTYDQRDQFKTDVDAGLDIIDDRIDMIGDKIDDQTGQMKDTYEKRLDAIKEHRDNLEKRMDNFDDTKDANWNQFKSGFRTAWMDLKNDVDKLGKDVGITDYNMNNQTKTY